MKQKNKLIILFAILFISGYIYFFRLNQVPNGFYVDEATVAYNAFSILKTGKDIYSQPYPILFRLLGSYTPPLFIYFSVPLIYLSGMEPLVFRSMSAVSALLSTVVLFVVINKLNIYKSKYTKYLITFLYSISPWLVFNARLGYEVTLGYMLFNFGIYFLFSALTNPKNLILGLSILSLSSYASHTQRYLLPIFLGFYFVVFMKEIVKKENKKYLLLAICSALIIQIPHFTVISTKAFWVKNERFMSQKPDRIFSSALNQTFSYLSPKSLFHELPDIDAQHTIPEMSVMYNWMVIPYFLGLYFLFTKIKKKSHKFLAILFFTSLIPAILSGEFISIQRALPFLLPLTLVVGLGIDYLLGRVRFVVVLTTFILLVIYSLTLLYRSYFVLFPKERVDAWNYGYSQIADFIKENPASNFVVDNTRNPRNYILLLYYLRYPPEFFQKEVDAIYVNNYYQSLPPETSYKFSNIEVRPIDWGKDSKENVIIIGDVLTVSESQAKEHSIKKVFEVRDPLKNVVFVAYKRNSEK